MTTSATTVDLVMAVYSNEALAQSAVDQLQAMATGGLIELTDAAIVTRDMDGKVHVNDLADKKKKGWGTGAVAGAVIGVIFPPSVLGSAIVGSAAGSLYHHFRDKGFENKELAKAGEELEPGQCALVAIVQDKFVAQLEQGIEGYSKLSKYLLDADAGVITTV